MEFERYDCEVDNGYAYMQPSADGDYVPYQQAQAVLEQLNSLNTALEKHFGPASIAEVSQCVEVYRTRIAELEAQKAMILKMLSLGFATTPEKILEGLQKKTDLNLG